MRKAALLALSLVLILLVCSCELTVQEPAKGRMHILVYGNDYAGTDSQLYKTIPDAIEVGNALIMLSEKAGYVYGVSYDITYLIGPSKYYNNLAIK